MEATLEEQKEEKWPKSQPGSTPPTANQIREGKGVMQERRNPSLPSCCKEPGAAGITKSIWPATISLSGLEGKNKEAPQFSFTSSIDVALNPGSELIVNLKRPLTWSVGANNTAHALSISPLLKYGPKRNGPSPVWRLSKKALGLEPPTPSIATNSNFSIRFSEQEEQDSPSQWLLVGSMSRGANSEKEYDPSELSDSEVSTQFLSFLFLFLSIYLAQHQNNTFSMVPHSTSLSQRKYGHCHKQEKHIIVYNHFIPIGKGHTK